MKRTINRLYGRKMYVVSTATVHRIVGHGLTETRSGDFVEAFRLANFGTLIVTEENKNDYLLLDFCNFLYSSKRKVVVAIVGYKGKTLVGEAICHKHDTYDIEVGKRVALSRALGMPFDLNEADERPIDIDWDEDEDDGEYEGSEEDVSKDASGEDASGEDASGEDVASSGVLDADSDSQDADDDDDASIDPSNIVNCKFCGAPIDKRDVLETPDGWVCDDCADQEYYDNPDFVGFCEVCGKPLYKGDVIYDDGHDGYYCNDCWTKQTSLN